MRGLFYVLGAIAGLLGLLSLFRTFEHVLAGDGFKFLQFTIGVLGISFAWLLVRKARAAT